MTTDHKVERLRVKRGGDGPQHVPPRRPQLGRPGALRRLGRPAHRVRVRRQRHARDRRGARLRRVDDAAHRGWHGGQVQDRDNEGETDRSDETWVAYDRQIVDDELYVLWGKFAEGVRVVVLS